MTGRVQSGCQPSDCCGTRCCDTAYGHFGSSPKITGNRLSNRLIDAAQEDDDA